MQLVVVTRAKGILSLVAIPLISNKEIPVITNVGKYSLYIYMLHRIPPLIISQVLIPNSNLIICCDSIIAFRICTVLSSKQVVDTVNNVTKIAQNNLSKVIIILLVILTLLYISQINFQKNKINYDKKDTITISFLGDLILLEDQIKLSKNGTIFTLEEVLMVL